MHLRRYRDLPLLPAAAAMMNLTIVRLVLMDGLSRYSVVVRASRGEAAGGMVQPDRQ